MTVRVEFEVLRMTRSRYGFTPSWVREVKRCADRDVESVISEVRARRGSVRVVSTTRG